MDIVNYIALVIIITALGFVVAFWAQIKSWLLTRASGYKLSRREDGLTNVVLTFTNLDTNKQTEFRLNKRHRLCVQATRLEQDSRVIILFRAKKDIYPWFAVSSYLYIRAEGKPIGSGFFE